jgi:hypothetical protein
MQQRHPNFPIITAQPTEVACKRRMHFWLVSQYRQKISPESARAAS